MIADSALKIKGRKISINGLSGFRASQLRKKTIYKHLETWAIRLLLCINYLGKTNLIRIAAQGRRMNLHSDTKESLMSKSDKREEIIRAALELVAGQGLHGAPVAELARRAWMGRR